MVAEVTPLLPPLFVVQLRGPHSSGFIVLRARDEDHAREIARDPEVAMPTECEITNVRELTDSGKPGPRYSCFEYGPEKGEG